MKKTLMTAAAGAILVLVPAGASAATITQQVSLVSPFFAVLTAGSTEFDQFDADLGTLTSVSFEYSFPNGLGYFSVDDYMFYYLLTPNFSTTLLKGSSLGYQGGTNLGSPAVINSSDSDIAQYIGTGTLALVANVSKSNPLSFVNTYGGVANVIYTYTEAAAAPEPSAWAMMLLGFGGLGATLRSRRRRARTQA